MQKKSALLVVVFFSLVVLACPRLYGQANGSLSGTVSDKGGAVISGATVKVTSQGTGVERETKTDDSGHYLVPVLPVAFYTIRVDFQGFQATEQKDIRLQVDEHREVDFTLAPASVTTAVEVNATEVAVETANPSLGQVITSEQVADLPLNGRDFVQLATLTPGVTQETNPNSFFNGGATSEVSARGSFSLSVGGSRPQSTDWLFDGNDNNELTAGGIAILPSIDAIQEFKVLTFTYSAEYGTRAGPTVLVTTKSGSNRFHGSLFEFFRNTKLDARSYFAASREQFNLNQFGGALGGPIQKDKTYFFVDYQGKRQRHGIESTGLVPTPAMMGGDFTMDPLGGTRGLTLYRGKVVYPNLVNPYSGGPFECNGTTPVAPNSDGTQVGGTPCNIIPTGVGGLADPAGQQLIRLYPGNNLSGPAAQSAGFNFTNAPVRSLNEGEFDVRLDHNFSSKDSIFARFSYDQANSLVPGGSSPTGPTGFAEATPFGSTQNISNHGRNVAISETHIFSSNTVNQISGGFNRIFNFIKSYGYGTCEGNELGILNANIDAFCNQPSGIPGIVDQSSQFCISCGLTSIQPPAGTYWSLGDRGFAPFQGGTNVFSISDSFDMIRGKHDIRVGGGIRANQMNVLTNSYQDGFFSLAGSVNGTQTGDAMADLLLGVYAFGEHDQTFQGATTGRRWKMFRPFVQDDWRVTPNLTLNLGFAWALVTPIVEAQNRQANFVFNSNCTNQPTCNLLVPGVNSDGRVGIQFDKTALEPRIGLSWKVLGSQSTVLRAGYAIFHDSSWNIGGQGLVNNPPFEASSALFPGFPGSCPGPAFPSAPTVQTCVISGGYPAGTGNPNPFGVGVFTAPPNINNFLGTVQSENTNFKQGMIQQFNLNVEHQLPGNIVLTAGYAGSRSSHILVNGLNWNVHSPSACGTTPGYTLGCGQYVNPNFLNFSYISNFTDTGAARYDSLQVKAETKSARHGIYALLGYTYSRTFDSGLPDGLGSNSGATYWPLPGANKLDWGVSGLNLNNQFTASVLYDLPFGKGKQFGGNWSGPVNAVLGGWSVNVIERAESGFPIFVYDSFNQSGVNFLDNFANWNRPDQICDPKSSHPTVKQWFNTQCFVAPPAGQLGTASRTPVYGPRFVNTDFSAIKNIRLSEAMNMDFRAEFFNLFNHAQFNAPGSSSTPGADLASPSSFGVITSTVGNPRVIQLALKLKF